MKRLTYLLAQGDHVFIFFNQPHTVKLKTVLIIFLSGWNQHLICSYCWEAAHDACCMPHGTMNVCSDA